MSKPRRFAWCACRCARRGVGCRGVPRGAAGGAQHYQRRVFSFAGLHPGTPPGLPHWTRLGAGGCAPSSIKPLSAVLPDTLTVHGALISPLPISTL